MANVPDLAGFRAAQESLVENLGLDVAFNFTDVNGYASGVYLDPEHGTPLDPTLSPSASAPASASVVVRATVIRRIPQLTRSGQNDGNATAGGVIPTGKAWLRIPAGTYDASILNATTVDINGETFTIDRFIEDGIGQVDRLYVECEMIGDSLTPQP
jgi:hypothetical protein